MHSIELDIPCIVHCKTENEWIYTQKIAFGRGYLWAGTKSEKYIHMHFNKKLIYFDREHNLTYSDFAFSKSSDFKRRLKHYKWYDAEMLFTSQLLKLM